MMDKDGEKTALSIRSTLAASIKSLEYLPDVEEDEVFSIREWVQSNQEEGWLFLTCMPEQRSALRSLLSGWFSVATKAMMGKAEDTSKKVWFIVDELPSLNHMPALPKALAEVRKYGGCFVLGLQDLSQLDDLYGVNVARTISGNTGTKVIFRLPDTYTATRMSEFLGKQEIIEPNESISYGAHHMRDGVNLSDQRLSKPTISYTDIIQLNNLEAYLQLPGNMPITKIKFEYHYL